MDTSRGSCRLLLQAVTTVGACTEVERMAGEAKVSTEMSTVLSYER